MADKIKIGSMDSRMTPQEEIEILKLKNGSRSGTEGLLWAGFNYSYTGGLPRAIFGELQTNPDWIQLRNVIETYFVNLFTWNGLDKNFLRKFERILFRYGKVAVFKTPDGEYLPGQFTYAKEDTDYYGNPRKITIVSATKFNGLKLREGNFVIVYNNHMHRGVVEFMWERFRQWTRALRDIDNNSMLSRPKWGANISKNDAAWVDVMDAMNSDAPIVPMGNIDFQEAGIQDLAGADRADSLITTYDFHLKNLLKLIGLQVNGAKLERQTELEVSKNDEFDALIFDDMLERRKEGVEALIEFGMTGVSVELELEEEQEQSEELNGATHKELVKGANNE